MRIDSPSVRRIGITLPGAVDARDAGRFAAIAEDAGCEAVWVLDVRREPYLLAAAAVEATNRVQVGTNVAVAFARSPTATAAAAWDLAIWSRNRFVLGLGSQVGPTLTARFGVTADHPGPRMRDYVLAVRACFSAFRTGRGGYEGEFYQIRRPAFQPGGEELAQDPPIYLGAVNPFMTRIAGEVADGLAAHPFTTPAYLREVLRPALAAGAERAGRPAPPLLLQLVVAPTREAAAAQMYTYAVPAYRRVLDHAGLDQAAERIFSSGREEARHLIAEHCLDHLGVIIGDDLEPGLERWAGLAERITLSVPWFGPPHPEQLTQIERLIARLRQIR